VSTFAGVRPADVPGFIITQAAALVLALLLPQRAPHALTAPDTNGS
jgi:hypothetical protein